MHPPWVELSSTEAKPESSLACRSSVDTTRLAAIVIGQFAVLRGLACGNRYAAISCANSIAKHPAAPDSDSAEAPRDEFNVALYCTLLLWQTSLGRCAVPPRHRNPRVRHNSDIKSCAANSQPITQRWPISCFRSLLARRFDMTRSSNCFGWMSSLQPPQSRTVLLVDYMTAISNDLIAFIKMIKLLSFDMQLCSFCLLLIPRTRFCRSNPLLSSWLRSTAGMRSRPQTNKICPKPPPVCCCGGKSTIGVDHTNLHLADMLPSRPSLHAVRKADIQPFNSCYTTSFRI